MGIVDLTQNDFIELQKLVKLLGVFGISEEDLRYLPEALKIVRDGGLTSTPKTMSKEEKVALEEKIKKILTPEEFFEQFKDNVEEFYPHGQDKAN